MTMKRIAALALAALLALLAAGAMAAATTPKVYKDGVELTDLYNSGTKRLTISQPGTYTIKNWYGAAPGDPTEGQIYIENGDDDEFVLNLENVCLTDIKDSNGSLVHIITNYIDGKMVSYPPEEQYLTVNFDGNSSLQNNSNNSSCIFIYANNDGIVTLGGTSPTLSASGPAVDVSTVVAGTAGIEVIGEGAVLKSNNCTLSAYAGDPGSTAYVKVSGKNAEITSTKFEAINCAATNSTVEVEISGEGAVITGKRYGIVAKDSVDSSKGSIVISAAAEISSGEGYSAVLTGSLTVKGCALYDSEDYAQLLGDSGELNGKAAGKTYLRTAKLKAPTVETNAGADSWSYSKNTKRLMISKPGTYTIKDWYGPTTDLPAEGRIYIDRNLSGEVVLNLENVRLTGDAWSLITNVLASDLLDPPEKLLLTVNFDGSSSLQATQNYKHCIYVRSIKDGKVTLGGTRPTLSSSDGLAVWVQTEDVGTAGIVVSGDGAELSSGRDVLYAAVIGDGGKANVTVSGKDARLISTSGTAIYCMGDVGAEVEISGRNATLQGVLSESISCQTHRGQALVSVSGDGAKIAGDYYGIVAKSTNSPEEGRIVLSAAAEISATGGPAVETGSLTVKGCALYASKDDSDLLGDASSGNLIGKAQGKAYLRTVHVDADAAASLPRTGDSSSLALWAGLLALSALALSRARRRA